ncbi:MAG: hypothetical protein WBO06_04400 [Gammaproteobacteria bacterium]
MSAASLHHQRGAVTLIGALFLIITLVVLLGAVQRMAATDIIDSALGNDGVEALYIAETGLERAAWRYAGGTSCPLLAGETAPVARGSFQILSAALAGTLCQVRVQGSVITTTAADATRRTVEAEFLLQTGGFGGWAVGEKDGGEAGIASWDGSSWSQPGPYTGVPDKKLFGVSCVAIDDCWAVGEDEGGELIIHWDGSSWSRAGPYGGIPDKKLFSVQCITSDDCWAVGEKDGGDANINHWDGSSWSSVAAPAVPDKDLTSVHCVASNDCWAVGKKDGGDANINHWDGSNWSSVTAPAVPDEDLNGIHMVSATEGYVTGKDGTFAVWDGSTWTSQASPTGKDLYAIAFVPGGGGGGSGGVQLVRWTEVIQ